jgi:Holliday junction DNA helicase RuvA
MAAAPLVAGPLEDAVSALVNLGYRRIDAHGAVLRASEALGETAAAPALIRAGLQALGKELAR